MSTLVSRHDSVPLCRTQFDIAGPQSPSTAVIDAIATVADTSPLSIEPLYETVELEALDRLLEHAGSNGSGIALEFRVDEWDLIVTGDGQVLVFEAEADDELELEFVE